MKRFLAAIVSLILLFAFSSCSKKDTAIVTGEVTTQKKAEENNDLSINKEFDSIDNGNGLKMKMYGDYYCTKDGLIHQFFDGKTVVSYSTLYDKTISSNPKDCDDFIMSLPSLFKPRIFEREGFKLSFTTEKVINGFNVKEFEGVITDSKDIVHNCKAYTFICGGYDCIVIAAPIENTDEMIEKMNKDIDFFMNNLEIDK